MAIQPPNALLPGIVQAIIASPHPSKPQKAQIAIDGADDLYRQIRIDNTLKDENGDEVSLKPGAAVRVTIKADNRLQSPRAKQVNSSNTV